MVLFLEELKVANYLQPHESLRNAILKYKKEVNKDPKYWASFSIFGIPYWFIFEIIIIYTELVRDYKVQPKFDEICIKALITKPEKCDLKIW